MSASFPDALSSVGHILLTPLLAQGDDPASAAPGGTTLLQQINAGGLVGYFILLLSVVAVAISIICFIRVRLVRFLPPALLSELTHHLSRRDIDSALAACDRPETSDSFLAQVISAGLRKYRRNALGPLEFRAAMEDAGAELVSRHYRSTDLLGWIGAAGPLLGLLGTVIGIIQAFEAIGHAKARPDLLAAGISKALVTTAMGLFVAIPATAVFTFLRNRIDHFSSHAAAVIDQLVAPIEPGGNTSSSTGSQPLSRPTSSSPPPTMSAAIRAVAPPAAARPSPPRTSPALTPESPR